MLAGKYRSVSGFIPLSFRCMHPSSIRYPLAILLSARPALQDLNKATGHKLQYNDLIILIRLLSGPNELATSTLSHAITTEHAITKLRQFMYRIEYLLSIQLISKRKTPARSFYSLTSKGKALLYRYSAIVAAYSATYE